MSLLSKAQRKEIFYHLINSGLAGALVFLGALTTGNITITSIMLSFIASGIVFLTKFKDYWSSEEQEYRSPRRNKKAQLFSFW